MNGTVEITGNNDEVEINYYQVVKQTRAEKIAMYMKCRKRDLAEMMANRDEIEEGLKDFASKQQDIDPEIKQYVNKHFWDLI